RGGRARLVGVWPRLCVVRQHPDHRGRRPRLRRAARGHAAHRAERRRHAAQDARHPAQGPPHLDAQDDPAAARSPPRRPLPPPPPRAPPNTTPPRVQPPAASRVVSGPGTAASDVVSTGCNRLEASLFPLGVSGGDGGGGRDGFIPPDLFSADMSNCVVTSASI